MYERHKRRYSLCDISKVDRTVDVVLLKVWCCLFTLLYVLLPHLELGHLFPIVYVPAAGLCGDGEQVEEIFLVSVWRFWGVNIWHEKV